MAEAPASYKFNSFEEIKSHSSILYNERMAILFYILDMKSIQLKMYYSVPLVLEVRAVLWQIYKNVRTLLRNNPLVRNTLNLETKDEGIYVTDVMKGTIDRMIEWCERPPDENGKNGGYTPAKIYIIVQQLDDFEMTIKDILQYFSYFIRPDFRQKPDIDMATETYKQMADARTVEELREIVGNNHKLSFDGLGDQVIDNPLLIEEEEDDYEEDIEEEVEKKDILGLTKEEDVNES
jgi:hypothetical protein